MGRKKRDMSCLRPFCFYCEKSFKNEVILHHHQKAKHFACVKCNKKFSSIDSLAGHTKTPNHDQIERVPNANQGRDSVGLKIFGMQGVPRAQIEHWINKNVNKYWGKIIDKKNEQLRKKQKEKQKQEQNKKKQENDLDVGKRPRPQEDDDEEIPEDINIPLSFDFN